MRLSQKVWDLIHKIEDKYGTLVIPDDNPLMVKLHKEMGVAQEFVKHDYDKEIIRLIKLGYNYREISAKVGHNPSACRRIAVLYGYHTRPVFKYVVKPENQPEIYLAATTNLQYFGISQSNHSNEVYKRMRKHINLITKRTHWCDIPQGGRYMVPKNNTKIFIKE
ncbi:MAG: hypothetical protein J6565_07470 [Lactobacillus sp.]|nr:hypothetical protein [Lactobacillus sp.]